MPNIYFLYIHIYIYIYTQCSIIYIIIYVTIYIIIYLRWKDGKHSWVTRPYNFFYACKVNAAESGVILYASHACVWLLGMSEEAPRGGEVRYADAMTFEREDKSKQKHIFEI